MNGRTHLLTGLAVGVALGASTGDYATAVIGSAIGALLPDIDHPQSILSGWLPGIGVFRWALGVKHRGITHTALFGVGVMVICEIISKRLGVPGLSVAVGVGILSHLILDMLTPMGIRMLYPIKINFGLPRPLTWLPWNALLSVGSILAIGAIIIYR